MSARALLKPIEKRTKVWVELEEGKWLKAIGEIQKNNYCMYETRHETGMVPPQNWKLRLHDRHTQDKPNG